MHPQGRLPARAAQQVRGALQDVLPVQRCAPAARRHTGAPPRGAAAHGAVFAAASDIQFLSHETIIDQMREMKVFKRKLKKVRRRTLAAALRRGC